jgi:hypothetical protein
MHRNSNAPGPSKVRLWLANLALITLVALPLLGVLLLATPLVGNAVGIALGRELGCAGSAARSEPCYFLGKDVGDIYYNYSVSVVALGITNPVTAISLVTRVIPKFVFVAWLTFIVGLFLFKARIKTGSRVHG